MKMRLSFYYVGYLQEAVHIYSLFLEGTPIYRDDNRARFRLEGGDFALHLDLRLQKSMTRAQIKYGAVVSFSVEDLLLALAQGRQWGFRQVGEITAQDYGKAGSGWRSMGKATFPSGACGASMILGI